MWSLPNALIVDLSVLLSYYVTAAVVRCAQVLYTENRHRATLLSAAVCSLQKSFLCVTAHTW